ncbi:NAD(P)-binding protein [Mucilaginibacter sp. HMF5004]|uniref:protoporphyrinogen/coproporphyrinogen oxidase n=1 Tax=Mucilaginibacter rivuli TaxID=2857527 RepID=UPI001C5FAEA4|nr:NAD(P)-binding protein [Mucilaginibacter rivuli]MBW4890100.1 NAD(P)-binding protein [Mucilaginibacter rivuli]
MPQKAIVIGSGISGLSIARMLQTQYDVKIIERTPTIGGLIKCERINGNLFHRVGGHVFNSKNPAVVKWFWDHFDKETEFLEAIRNAKILFNDKLIGYPIENFLHQLPPDLVKKIVKDLLNIIKEGYKAPETYSDFKAFLLGNFGETLYELYFGPYNTKIWNTDISKVPLEWLEGKLPMPKIDDVIISNIVKQEESEMVHSRFYYPVRDGSQFIINRLAQGLDITPSYNVSSIKSDDGRIIVNGELDGDLLVYCGDIRLLSSIIDTSDKKLNDALAEVTGLLSNGTSNVLCETDDNDISWLYLPEDKFKAHRIIYTGNFSPTNNEGTNRKTCVVEFSGKHNEADMVKELELLPGNLKPLAFNYEPNSYIIQQKQTREKIERVKQLLATRNIYLLGRFAEWEYYNMDKCIESAMQLHSILI